MNLLEDDIHPKEKKREAMLITKRDLLSTLEESEGMVFIVKQKDSKLLILVVMLEMV